ncbi:MAG TPA: integrase [Methylococcaceae bacterium]|nr:integrase [Methylococcaceae bacterium]
MIKKNGDKWLVDIQPGGRGNKRYRKSFNRKADAVRYETLLKSRIDENPSYELPKKDNRTLIELVTLWYENTGKHLNSGLDSFNRMKKASIAMGNLSAQYLNPSVFISYRTEKIESGVKPATLNRELATFKAVFNDLIRTGNYNGTNVFNKIRKIKTHEAEMTYLTNNQISSLFSALKSADSDAYLIAKLCLATGARWGEAQSLKIENIKSGQVYYHNTKSKKSRSVPVTDELIKELNNRLSQGPFFDAYSTFTRKLYDTGINLPKGQRTHVLRHTFASHYIMKGGNILALQRILGHSSLNVTMRYAHLAPDYLKEILDINPSLTIG